MPSRAAIVALLALVAVAGCVGGPASSPTESPTTTTVATTTDGTTTATPTTDSTSATTDRRSTTRDCYYEGYEVETREVSPAEVAEELARPIHELDYRPRQVARAALADGSATTTVLGDERPLDDGDVLRENGTYYAVERTTVTSEIVTADGFELDGPLDPDYDEQAYDAAEAEAVAFKDLSAPDRRVFLAGVPRGDRLDHLVSGGGSLAAGYRYAFHNDSARANSRLVEDGPHYVEFRDAYWRVAPTGDRRSTERVTYRYRLETAADSTESFGADAVERYAVALNESFGSDERDLLAEAFDAGVVDWSGCEESPPLVYQSLSETLSETLPDGRLAYVRHDGTLYRVTVVHVIE